MAVQRISYFGYGSLVNRDTRPIGEDAIDVHLRGWRRAWSHRVSDTRGQITGCTSLTVEPAQCSDGNVNTGIDGVLVDIPADDLPELDRRESGYERICLPVSDFDLPEGYDGEHIMVYRSLPHNRKNPDGTYPILQSYVDCVLAGYSRRFGKSGLSQMIESTRGWEHPILDDRSNPVYPRHVPLHTDVHDHFDSLIESHRYTCGQ